MFLLKRFQEGIQVTYVINMLDLYHKYHFCPFNQVLKNVR